MPTLLDTILAAIDAKRAQVKEAWAPVKQMQDAAKSGTFDINDTAQWKRFEDAGDAYESLREELTALESKRDRAIQMTSESTAVNRFLLNDGDRSRQPVEADQRWSKAAHEQIQRHGLDLKAVTAGGFTLPPVLDPGLIRLGERPRFVRDLIPVTPLDETDRFTFLRQTVRTNLAAAVAAGAVKPTSVFTLERVEAAVSVVGHLSEAIDRSILMDLDSLGRFLDAELRLGVLVAEDNQLLNGDGVAPNQRGILNTVGIGTQARGADSRTDAVRKAIRVIRAAELVADYVVLNPTDWQTMSLEKDADGNYIYGRPGAPVNAAEFKVWGLPVLETLALAQGTAIVGAFRASAELFERESTVVAFTENAAPGGVDLFSRNQFIARAEERIGLAVTRPAGFCTVTGM